MPLFNKLSGYQDNQGVGLLTALMDAYQYANRGTMLPSDQQGPTRTPSTGMVFQDMMRNLLSGQGRSGLLSRLSSLF